MRNFSNADSHFEHMGFLSTTKWVTLAARRKGRARDGFRKFGPPVKQWEDTKRQLDSLLVGQRLTGPLLRMKELQQYAEEIVQNARRNTSISNSVVESMLISSEARQVLYEKLVPRYLSRPAMFTRVVNLWHRRETDSTRIGFIEFVDRRDEFVPASPVGEEKQEFIDNIMQFGTRRERRRYS